MTDDCSDAVAAALATALADMAGPHLRSGVRKISPVDDGNLFAVEREAMRRFVPTRASEFATGRMLLRDLIGLDVPIPIGADRAPVVPAGFLCSMAHERQFVVAVVTDVDHATALGIDIEPMDELPADVSRFILRADEAIDAHLAFTLKEATYKAWSSLGGRLLEHHDVRVRVHDGSFTADVVTEGAHFAGTYRAVAGRWLAQVVA